MIETTLLCLALNMYFEARSEPIAGQIAVAEVTLNRVASPHYPNTVCEVVLQDNSEGCQFSWWCDGKSDTPTEPQAFQRSKALAKMMIKSGIIFFTQKKPVAYDSTNKNNLRNLAVSRLYAQYMYQIRRRVIITYLSEFEYSSHTFHLGNNHQPLIYKSNIGSDHEPR